MKRPYFDVDGFWAAIDALRQTNDLSWRQVARETAIGASTLTRLGQGKAPDALGLASLCKWGDLRPESFLRDSDGATVKGSSLTQLVAVLHTATDLSEKKRDAIEEVLKVMYRV